MKKILLFLLIATIGVGFSKAEITTPYPETIVLKQINGAEKERIRLCHGQKKYDKQPTGFYVYTGKKVVVNVEILTPAEGNDMPVLTVGTLGFNVDNRNTGTAYTLKAGNNTISNHSGGLIWLSFIENGSSDPKGVARITFTETSEHVRAPRFVLYTTKTMEFEEMLIEYPTPDVLYQSDYVVIVATKEAANQFSKDNNKVAWLNEIHTLLEKEDEISGMDNNDPNPVHHRLKAGEVRHLLTQNTSSNPHASSAGYTGYPHGSRSRYLTIIGVEGNNSWMLGHEIGHQHQQPAYQINMATESTVNIYSYVVERNIVERRGGVYNRTSAERWQTARNTYLKLPMSKRVYDMPDDDLRNITGFNHDELRFMVWEQFFLIFGDDFYHRLHRVVREEKVSRGGNDDERRAYLIWKASQITGYDLTEFLNLWGIRVTNSAIKANLRAKMAYAKSKDEIHDLSEIGRTPAELTRVTGQSRPTWTPIPMRGISMSAPENEIFDTQGWTVTTKNAVGYSESALITDDPMALIDNATTCFAFVKPGKSLNGINGAEAGKIPSFTIDMKETKTFNTFIYTHRTSNASSYLRTSQFSIYGSNDGEEFSEIIKNYNVNPNKNPLTITLNEHITYRYIKLEIEDWDKDNGNTIQIQEFQMGNLSYQNLPTPPPIQFKVNVAADDGIVTTQDGANMVDEDSNFLVSFTIADNAEFESLTIDGDIKTPTIINGINYTYALKVSNHVDVNITSKVKSGLINIPHNSLINIYPNVVNRGEFFNINIDGFDIQNATVSVFNTVGSKLSEEKIDAFQTQCKIDQEGIYIVEVKNDKYRYASKVMVK